MPSATIYCFCSHNGSTVSWWSAIETGGRGQERKEYISGTVENATTGIGILTAIHRSISKTDAGIAVKILTTVSQNLYGGENRDLKSEITRLIFQKSLKVTLDIADSEELQIRSGRRKIQEPVSTGNWISGTAVCKCGATVKTEFLAVFKRQHKQFQCSCGETVRAFYDAA